MPSFVDARTGLFLLVPISVLVATPWAIGRAWDRAPRRPGRVGTATLGRGARTATTLFVLDEEAWRLTRRGVFLLFVGGLAGLAAGASAFIGAGGP